MSFLSGIYHKYFLRGPADIKYLILWFMGSVYPLIVIPNSMLNYFYAPRYVVLAAVTLFAVYVLVREKARVDFSPDKVVLAIFVVISMLSTVLAIDPVVALLGNTLRFTGFSTYFFCAVLFILATMMDETEKLLGCMIGCASIVAFLAVLQYLGLNIVPHEPFREHSFGYGTMGNRNFLGTYTAFILPGAILFYLRHMKRYWLVCSAFIYAGLLVSFTRGAWLAFLLSFILVSRHAFKVKESYKYLVWVMVVLLLVTCLLMPLRDGFFVNRVFTIPGELTSAVQLKGDAGAFRMHIWLETIKLLPDYWVFGMGPDNLKYAGIHTPDGALSDKAHNIYLEMAVTMGIFAMLAYLVFLALILWACKNDGDFVFFIMILTYLVQGFVNIDVVMVMPLFWIVLGLSLASAGVSKSRVELSNRVCLH